MAARPYDAIVLGAGGVGSAAMRELSGRGMRVLGIDRFAPPHDRGSSHGQTRIIRQAYFEHPDYVPLAVESYREWENLEQEGGQSLKVETGLLQIGPAEGAVVRGVKRAAAEHGLSIESGPATEFSRRWPTFSVPDGAAAVFEKRAGYLRVEACVAACLAAAKARGAELLSGVEVLQWSGQGDVVVRTTAGEFHAARLVVTAGPWAGPLLADLGLSLSVRRKAQMWHAAADPAWQASAGTPCFLYELPKGVLYGFPAIDKRGVKVAEHSGGDPVADPLAVDRALRASDRAPVEAFIRQWLPGVRAPCVEHAVCMYTMSPDEHFIVDRHPRDPRVVFAAGLSGHGFKFAPVLGQVLADLAIEGETSLPVEFLSLRRFARS